MRACLEAKNATWQLEQLRLFDIIERLVERFMQGQLPIRTEAGGQALEQYYLDRDERLTRQQRFALYTRVLGAPGADDANVTPNREFDDLLRRFVAGVTDFGRQQRVADVDAERSEESHSLKATGSDSPDANSRSTAYEVERIPMEAVVAYLSCCETASGRPTTDGVIGLARSYLLAGVNAVVATLWRVDDLVAAATAQHFYAGLLHDRLSIAQSVRYAALETRRDLRDGRLLGPDGKALPELPMLWAAHVAIGDASHRVGDGRAD